MKRWAALLLVLAASILAACGGGESDTESGGGPLLGFNEAFLPDSPGNELLAESDADFVRVALTWARAEQLPGETNFDAPDAIAEELDALGLNVLWVVTSAPCWATDLACSGPGRPSLAPRPEHFDEYAAFVTEVAERYPDAVGIEVWNEPNIPNFWRTDPDAATYRALLTETAEAVHESGSDVPVVMAGPSPTTEEQAIADPQKIPFLEFIEEVMSGPDRPDVDAIGVHPYSLLQSASDPTAETIRLYEEARDAAERAAPGVPVWVTEVGLTTAGRSAVSPEEQASGLETIVAELEADGVPVIAIHRFFDQADPPFAFEEGFGVVAADRTTRKPAFCVIPEAAGVDCQT